MKIGIDGRLIEETGVGRYIRNLARELGQIDKENRYVIFLRKKSFDSFIPPNQRWEKRLADVPWHSFTEQFVMPWLFTREHLDLLHVPYFNIPIFYPGKLIVTIHDLTILHFDTGKATTLPLPLYKLRRLGYYLVLAVGLVRAMRIIAVSNDVKKEIIDHFRMPQEKIAVTYEGVERLTAKGKPLISDPYFLYVGNAYPHKNLGTLVAAFGQVKENAKLVLVGKDDFFYERLKSEVAGERIIFFGQASDTELANLYNFAIALVFPSLMEGFGLPALEALSLRCPVICSDIPVFHEILDEHATYFDPTSPDDIRKKLEQAIKSPKKPEGFDQLLKRFSWSDMAKRTLLLYHSAA